MGSCRVNGCGCTKYIAPNPGGAICAKLTGGAALGYCNYDIM